MDVIVCLLVSVFLANFVHEFGHFLGARLASVRVPRMLVGVGPAHLGGVLVKQGGMNVAGSFTRTTRRGTEFTFGPIPVVAAQFDEKEFRAERPGPRLVVSAAGSATNFILAFVVLAVAYVGFHPPAPALLGATEVDGRAYAAGMRSGDRIVAVDGRAADTWGDVGRHLLRRVGDTGTMTLGVERGGARQEYRLAIDEWQSDVAWVDVFAYLGVRAAPDAAAAGSILGGVADAFRDTARTGWSTAMAGFSMLAGNMSVLNFGGGMPLTQLGLHGADLSLNDYLKLFALFSLYFGIINLLPGPIVDGLAILTAAVEWIGRVSLTPGVDRIANAVGVVLAFGPLPLVAVYDVLRVLA